MVKAIFAAVVTFVMAIVGFDLGSSINGSEFIGIVFAICVMGGCIIFFNERNKDKNNNNH